MRSIVTVLCAMFAAFALPLLAQEVGDRLRVGDERVRHVVLGTLHALLLGAEQQDHH